MPVHMNPVHVNRAHALAGGSTLQEASHSKAGEEGAHLHRPDRDCGEGEGLSHLEGAFLDGAELRRHVQIRLESHPPDDKG